MNGIGFHTTSLIINYYNYEILKMKLNPASSGAEGLSGLFRLRELGIFPTDGVESLDSLLGGQLCPLLHRLQEKGNEA